MNEQKRVKKNLEVSPTCWKKAHIMKATRKKLYEILEEAINEMYERHEPKHL
uniref:Promoter 3 n=1 Tax=Bacillus phage SPP1 TaxID=10724 RepID=Q38591_BPSPP|nr:promoter 3 protein [Bacillus phage SPP1]